MVLWSYFFFSSRRRHTRCSRDWSSDVCSSDLELVNEPSNRLTPRILADRAAAMAREVGLATDVLDESRIEELKMGGLLAVVEGSAVPAPVIIGTFTPPAVRPGAPEIGLVGKGVAFVTAGDFPI